MKACTRCGDTKDTLAFNRNKSKSDGLSCWCRECSQKYRREYNRRPEIQERLKEKWRKHNKKRLQNPETKKKIYAQNKEYRNRPEIKIKRKYKLMDKLYGEGAGFWYQVRMTIQNGKCAVCGEHFGDKLVLDHDHKTGEWRGLLCNNCNTAIGLLHENPHKMMKAINYLNFRGSVR